MLKGIKVFLLVFFCVFSFLPGRANARAIKTRQDTIKQNAGAAHAEEKDLQGRIREALQSGDMAKADQLKARLRAQHRENMQEKQRDMAALKKMRKENKRNIKKAGSEYRPPKHLPAKDQPAAGTKPGMMKRKKAKVNKAWEKKADRNNDGTVDQNEMKMWRNKHHVSLRGRSRGTVGGPSVGHAYKGWNPPARKKRMKNE